MSSQMQGWSDITKPVRAAGVKVNKWTHDVVYWKLVYEHNWQPLPDFVYRNSKIGIPGQCRVCLWVNDNGPQWSGLLQGRGACHKCAGGNRVTCSEARAMLASKSLAPIEPMYFLNSITPIPCWCLKCGKSTKPTYNCLRRGRNGCANCSGLIKRTDDEVRAMFEAAGCTPIEPIEYKGNRVPVPSTCHACSEVCSPIYSRLQQGYGPCSCSKRGLYDIKNWQFCSIDGGSYDVDNSGFYIIEFWMNGQRRLKRGIDSTPGGTRVKFHVGRGANVLYYERMNLSRAILLEQAVLEALIGPDNWKPLRGLNSDPDYPLHNGGNECFEPSGVTVPLWSHSQDRYVEVAC